MLFKFVKTLDCIMASSFRNPKDKEPFKVQLVNKEVKQLDFRAIPKVAYKNDSTGALLIIPPKVVMVQCVRKCYNCKIGGIGDIMIHWVYKNYVRMVY